MKRMFRCENGHEYESKKSITSSIGQLLVDMLGKNVDIGANDFCKICGGIIVSETDYENGRIVAGAVLTI